jgi:tetratricopeptide (TPR) repeat protein
VARLHQDTNWIFDDLRGLMAAGRCDRVVHQLTNYLGDPDSPRRDEATFLRAVCYEKLGRRTEAIQAYRQYLRSWPAGARATDARQAMRRIRWGG